MLFFFILGIWSTTVISYSVTTDVLVYMFKQTIPKSSLQALVITVCLK